MTGTLPNTTGKVPGQLGQHKFDKISGSLEAGQEHACTYLMSQHKLRTSFTTPYTFELNDLRILNPEISLKFDHDIH